MYKLGVDVGGTNTDVVLIDENFNLIAEVKLPTTNDIYGGISVAITKILQKSKIDQTQIRQATLGTTQCTNAIVERFNLVKVGVLRIGAPATKSIKPMLDWADDLKSMACEVEIINGGYEHDGKEEIAPFDENAARDFFKRCKQKSVNSVAISSVFSTVRNDHEQRAAIICHEIMGKEVNISVSNKIGNIGLIERENATILNSMLYRVSRNITEGFTRALIEQNILNAKVYFSQNDGTLMNSETACKYPILTIACGPTNSIHGASYLSKMTDAIIIDIGGTTTDIGIIKNGFPRESSIAATIGGVRTNFRMPDIVSFGVGGGSVIRQNANGKITIGPDSVGAQISNRAIVFGGDTLTLTDIAVSLGFAKIGNPARVSYIDKKFAEKVMSIMTQIIEKHIDIMKISNKEVDAILVGGGSIIFPNQIKGIGKLLKPKHFAVANAIGAATSKISGKYEKLVSYDEITREKAIEEAKKEAVKMAIKQGARKNTIEIVDVDELALQYYSGNTFRLKIKAIGELD